jgi:hypothetical protein
MSSPEPSQQAEPSILHTNKPLTAAFDLETKIRVIIQEVLTATIRKYQSFY